MVTSKFILDKPERTKMSFENLIGKKMTKSSKFMGEDVKISKLSVSQILEIQRAAKEAENDESKGFEILKTIIRASAEGAKDIADESFEGFPMDELSKLSNEIMAFSGIGADAGKGK
jgi:hypothetical protein